MDPLFAANVGGNLPQGAIGWGTLSLINAGLAQSKGHSGLFWWFLSLILGPIATFLIVVFLHPPTPPPLPTKPPDIPEVA